MDPLHRFSRFRFEFVSGVLASETVLFHPSICIIIEFEHESEELHYPKYRLHFLAIRHSGLYRFLEESSPENRAFAILVSRFD